MQEVITLVVFAGFSALYLGRPLGRISSSASASSRWRAFFVFH
jgi:uncharacterized protein (DUF486 family)